MTSLHHFIEVDLVRSPRAAFGAASDASDVGLLVLGWLLLEDAVLRCESRILVLRKREAESDGEVVTEAHLCHFLALELSDSLRGRSRDKVAMAKLTDIVRTPGIAST